jgi:ABC-type iron transport system FetAB permease component
MKLGMPKALVATESEYRANLTGLNTFFGAVLGFVMAGTERLDAIEFAYVLFMVSGAVISILYVHASSQKIAYAVLTFLLIAALPHIVANVLDQGEALPDKLQPTLYVWAALSVLVEYFPRRPDEPPAPPA